MTRGFVVAGAALLLTALGGVLVVSDSSPTAIAVVTGLALGLIAWAIAVGTDALGDRLGPAATGVVQSTVGNLPGFFIVLFALADGEVIVAQTSILGGASRTASSFSGQPSWPERSEVRRARCDSSHACRTTRRRSCSSHLS